MSENKKLETQDLIRFWETFKNRQGFDQECFLQLVEDTGEDTTLKILARFTETLNEAENHVEQGKADYNADPVWRACHKVAGSANLIGFTAYGHFARELSYQIRANLNMDHFSPELELFLQQTREIQKQIKDSVVNLNEHL